MSAKVVYETFCNGNEKLIKKVSSKFVGHVFPGEHLIVEMWKNGNHIYYESKVKERGTTALKAMIELREDAKLWSSTKFSYQKIHIKFGLRMNF